MDRLKDLQKRRDLRVIVVVQYGAAESESASPPWYGPPTLTCAADRGFETLDTHPLLHRVAEADRERFVSFWLNEGGQLGHMAPAGNRFIAEEIFTAFFGAGRATDGMRNADVQTR